MAFSPLGGGLYLGWALGANDAANVFGTAVATRVVNYRTATWLCGAFVILGAVLQGEAGIETLSAITDQTVSTAVIVTMAAAVTGTIMTVFGMPISTSQAVVGAILGIGLATKNTDTSELIKVIICWIGTPIGAMAVAVVVFRLLAWLIQWTHISMFTRDNILRYGLLLAGIYGSYALGANNVTNTTGMFSGLLPGVNDGALAAIGGTAIAVGSITYSRRVMMSLGKGMMRLDAFTALVAVLGMSVTVHVFAMVGVPVSTSQGIVGAILGIGALRGAHAINFRWLWRVAIAWVATPFIALILSAAAYAIFL